MNSLVTSNTPEAWGYYTEGFAAAQQREEKPDSECGCAWSWGQGVGVWEVFRSRSELVAQCLGALSQVGCLVPGEGAGPPHL